MGSFKILLHKVPRICLKPTFGLVCRGVGGRLATAAEKCPGRDVEGHYAARKSLDSFHDFFRITTGINLNAEESFVPSPVVEESEVPGQHEKPVLLRQTMRLTTTTSPSNYT